MSFQPVIPFGGYAGWSFLQRTMESQKEAFEKTVPIQRATDAFRERIGSITSAADLVADRQLLEVALGAFGLGDDINNKFFIRKILEDGSLKEDALANRLSDKRYLALTKEFGFGDIGNPGKVIWDGFADKIIARYEERMFEVAVGEQNNDMRLALNFATEIQEVTARTKNLNAQWLSIMGSKPLRTVVETALGLPSGLARIDLDQQVETFKDRAQSIFGTDKPADLATPENQERLIRLFLVRSEAASMSSLNSANIALTLLQNIA